ncbi:Hpt domain-containing protein [Maridesulfovibrio sp. FT414]|uniref:Hpt domain-containing protein n=1 Tax=Maridesulfovibrio sp. FT414 TaxID=2979469 RepID=UPI003D804A4E
MADIIIEKIERDLEGLVSAFMENTLEEIAVLEKAMAEADLQTAYRMGHNIKGSALNYGFLHLAEIGRAIEIAAGAGELRQVQQLLDQLRNYVRCVEIVFK